MIAIEEMSAQLADKDKLIKLQLDEIQLLKADVKRQQEKMIELAKKLPKRGEWVENDNGTYSCNRCGSWIPNEQHYYARYCLYCGAKMEDA